MLAPIVLLAFAALAVTLGPRLLLGSAWVRQAPGWGVLAWQALTLSILAAAALFGFTLAAPVSPLAELIARLFNTTPTEVIEHYRTPAGVWVAYTAVVVVAGFTVWMLWLTTSTLIDTTRSRRAHLRLLRLLGRDHPGGFVLVEHSQALVYCLPGLRKRVVVTTAALELLDAHQLELVLAHEKSHLRSRHDIAIALTDVLRRTFGPLRLFTIAHEQVRTLIEMQADDAAHDRHGLARALVTLGSGTPEPGIGAGDVATFARIQRLTDGAGSWKRRQSLAVCLATAALLATPIALATMPMIEMIIIGCTTVLG
ncbi:M56 family metallopeptidase [Aeromicrobium piscarium]|uniref:M56 family metallopeptidase n=1 Tax=Aeromicrobium piscarium TaxID=2590901 RepID=A0A554RG01_9ACTN|nr:M56 family metallopeptidase [Aeromicrobium piscarium]TSD52962.1 M56 family metallopeptidase [Aeromicrobium piscarium]